ncbi:protein kinase domain [Synechococcus sp. PCC 7335]|uniref:serine/threonine protein kinase n=1 Tax=Synechococcus sp. (strain ATCC 29403 / PCC 7335) TaxID=91464 RepID=UPI00017EE728|nr:serine/threonine-protein kinase [Synechococcus sp. PCC 7335]EDX84782.1 protein kinase domain [Synechococcus sp. PCC 7335]
MIDSNAGRTVCDRYELIETIGQGSMGRVYLASDSLLGGIPVAVKFLSQTLLNENMRMRFLREAMTCAQLGQRSIHVVRVTDYGVNEDEVPFYVMEYLKGNNIGQVIQKKPLPVPRFLGLTRQILLGLKTAHSGISVDGKVVPIIHRDIKPSNILVTIDPSIGELVKILDFGIAKLLQEGDEQTSTFMGTLAYASPEQMEGRKLDNRSDIYSLGVMMYQMLASKLPVTPGNNTFGSWYKAHRLTEPEPLIKAYRIPKELNDVVMACLSKRRADRPSTVSDIIEALSPLEKRFGSSFQISQRISTTLSKLPIAQRDSPLPVGVTIARPLLSNELDLPSAPTKTAKAGNLHDALNQSPEAIPIDDLEAASQNHPKPTRSPNEQFYLEQKWPAEIPIAQVVFPRLLSQAGETAATLWAMMPNAEIEKRIRNTRYNNFICAMTPHPMVLWLSAFYNRNDGPRWMPCYLDLKKATSQAILWQLTQNRQYQILFFTLESPHHCSRVKKFNVATSQLKLLQNWAVSARQTASIGSPAETKALLRRELDNNLKPKVTMNFEAMHSEKQPAMDASLSFLK